MKPARPWLKAYGPGVPADIVPEFPNALAMFKSSVAANPQRPLVYYFDRTLTMPPDAGIVLTDNFNPVDYFDAANREAIRRRLAEEARDL